MNRHVHPHVARIVLGTLAAVALLAAMSAVAAAEPSPANDQFAPGWQQDARPLFLQGPLRMSTRDKWRVPGNLPRGDYVVVRRHGDKAELVPGARFHVPSGIVEQYLFLDPGLGDVQALPVADVPALKPAAGRP